MCPCPDPSHPHPTPALKMPSCPRPRHPSSSSQYCPLPTLPVRQVRGITASWCTQWKLLASCRGSRGRTRSVLAEGFRETKETRLGNAIDKNSNKYRPTTATTKTATSTIIATITATTTTRTATTTTTTTMTVKTRCGCAGWVGGRARGRKRAGSRVRGEIRCDAKRGGKRRHLLLSCACFRQAKLHARALPHRSS